MRSRIVFTLGLLALAACSGEAGVDNTALTPLASAPVDEVATTAVEVPATITTPLVPATTSLAPVVPVRLPCDLGAVSADQDTGSLSVSECIGDWMITYSNDCLECEGVIPFHQEDGQWKRQEPLYAYCYSVPSDYGPDSERAILTTLQIAISGYSCDETDKGYHPERATGQLGFGDIGTRVTALQQALFEQGFLRDSVDSEFGPATIRAVMNFQYSQNIPADGFAGPNTHELLGLAYS